MTSAAHGKVSKLRTLYMGSFTWGHILGNDGSKENLRMYLEHVRWRLCWRGSSLIARANSDIFLGDVTSIGRCNVFYNDSVFFFQFLYPSLPCGIQMFYVFWLLRFAWFLCFLDLTVFFPRFLQFTFSVGPTRSRTNSADSDPTPTSTAPSSAASASARRSHNPSPWVTKPTSTDGGGRRGRRGISGMSTVIECFWSSKKMYISSVVGGEGWWWHWNIDVFQQRVCSLNTESCSTWTKPRTSTHGSSFKPTKGGIFKAFEVQGGTVLFRL